MILSFHLHLDSSQLWLAYYAALQLPSNCMKIVQYLQPVGERSNKLHSHYNSLNLKDEPNLFVNLDNEYTSFVKTCTSFCFKSQNKTQIVWIPRVEISVVSVPTTVLIQVHNSGRLQSVRRRGEAKN